MDGFPVPEVAAGEMQGLGEPQTAVDIFNFFKPKIYRHLLHEREVRNLQRQLDFAAKFSTNNCTI